MIMNPIEKDCKKGWVSIFRRVVEVNIARYVLNMALIVFGWWIILGQQIPSLTEKRILCYNSSDTISWEPINYGELMPIEITLLRSENTVGHIAMWYVPIRTLSDTLKLYFPDIVNGRLRKKIQWKVIWRDIRFDQNITKLRIPANLDNIIFEEDPSGNFPKMARLASHLSPSITILDELNIVRYHSSSMVQADVIIMLLNRLSSADNSGNGY